MPNTTFTGWAIDRDYLAESGERSRVGTGQTEEQTEERWGFMGRNITIRADLKASDVVDPIRFRLLDDDGEVYYGGSISREWLDGDEELAFSALEFGTADAGATEMQYRDGEEWKTL